MDKVVEELERDLLYPAFVAWGGRREKRRKALRAVGLIQGFLMTRTHRDGGVDSWRAGFRPNMETERPDIKTGRRIKAERVKGPSTATT